MSQTALTLPPPKLSGAALAEDISDIAKALASCRSGSARPVDVQTPELWFQIVSETSWLLNLWDGTVDLPLGELNPVAHLWTPSGVVAQATTEVAGISRKASIAEAVQGTDPDPYVTPPGLAAAIALAIATATPAIPTRVKAVTNILNHAMNGGF